MQGHPQKTQQSTPPRVVPRLLVAWLALLIASNLYYILWGWNESALHWPVLLRALSLFAIAAAISFSSGLKPLRGFVVALAALGAGDWVRFAIVSNAQWFRTASVASWILADAVVAGIPAGFMLLTAILSGLRRRDLFLVQGDISSRTTIPLLHRARWNIVAPIFLMITSAGLIYQLQLVAGAPRRSVGLAGVAIALLFAAINASFEEIRFRCVLLAYAEPVLGRTHAIWLTAVLFGLGHWGGHPSGVSGVIMAGFLGWLLAISILDTRGWAWAWLIHAVEDVIIFWLILATGK